MELTQKRWWRIIISIIFFIYIKSSLKLNLLIMWVWHIGLTKWYIHSLGAILMFFTVFTSFTKWDTNWLNEWYGLYSNWEYIHLSRDEKLESFNIEIRNMLWNNICDGVWISKVNKKPKCINSVIVQGIKGVQL